MYPRVGEAIRSGATAQGKETTWTRLAGAGLAALPFDLDPRSFASSVFVVMTYGYNSQLY